MSGRASLTCADVRGLGGLVGSPGVFLGWCVVVACCWVLGEQVAAVCGGSGSSGCAASAGMGACVVPVFGGGWCVV